MISMADILVLQAKAREATRRALAGELEPSSALLGDVLRTIETVLESDPPPEILARLELLHEAARDNLVLLHQLLDRRVAQA